MARHGQAQERLTNGEPPRSLEGMANRRQLYAAALRLTIIGSKLARAEAVARATGQPLPADVAVVAHEAKTLAAWVRRAAA